MRCLPLFLGLVMGSTVGLACDVAPVVQGVVRTQAVAQPAELPVDQVAPQAGEQPEQPGEQAAELGAPAPDEPAPRDVTLCEGFVQPGCIQTGCPPGQVCRQGSECVPSLCSCDPQTGESKCSLDCGGGSCVDAAYASACPPMVCRMMCPFGFERDENGCEVCECKEAPRCSCLEDDDCVKVVLGCCPCEMGGTETAIAKDCTDRIQQCPVPPGDVPCIAFNRCTSRRAACVAGVCMLQNSL